MRVKESILYNVKISLSTSIEFHFRDDLIFVYLICIQSKLSMNPGNSVHTEQRIATFFRVVAEQ